MNASFRSIGLVAAVFVTCGAVAPAQAQQGQQGRPPAQAQRERPPPPTLPDGPWDLQTETGMVHVSVLTKGLESPWGLAFLPDGGMLVTERPGRLRVVRNGKLDDKPIEGLPDLVATGISGLFGIALHPDFARNRLVYLAYPKPQGADRDSLTLAVARARWDGGPSLADVKDIFVAKDYYSTAMSSANNRCCGQGPSSGSFGARLEFDKQNRLYITSGDRNWGEKAQDPSSHIGKIVRVNDDGSVPKDNPFVGKRGYLPEIYTLGHRNQTGLRFDPETGDLWSTEFGPAGGDELNRIEAGKNYGWLLITHGNHYNNEPKKLGTGGVEGYVDPVVWWPRGGNPGNLIVYRGDLFPAWQGNVLVATMSNRALGPGLVRAVIGANGALEHEERMLTEIGTRMRDVVQGPDGKLYVLIEASAFASPGAILVVEPGAAPAAPARPQ